MRFEMSQILIQQQQIQYCCLMGKKKQQKLYRLNFKKQDAEKDNMKNIMKELAQMKKDNQAGAKQLVSITQINQRKKKIRKQDKQQKYSQKMMKQKELKIQQKQQELVDPHVEKNIKKVNIFAVDGFDSGVKTIINNPLPIQKMDEQIQLESEAKKLMGGLLNLDRFGQKQLKVIEQNEPVVLSDDEDQPNSFKNITHQNIKIPEGNFKFDRSQQIAQFRQKLPIYMKEQQIIETINNHLVTLICGETGSGKSTQIGQFLIEKNYHQFGKIAITQPRRLATISLAARVAQETNTHLGQLVGYQVRHDRKESQGTLIKYLTDGILLNQMNSDFFLYSYSVIVIDEAHERKVNTDILIGLLSKLVLARYKLSLEGKCYPLRLVIMSATMRVEDFKNEALFNYYVPIINVESRMFPVTIYFQKNTPDNYKLAAIKKCLKIHKNLPAGDVLIFLTGKQEIHQTSIMLEQVLTQNEYLQEQSQEQNQGKINELITEKQQNNKDKPKDFKIHCLYSSLPMNLQQKIFEKTPQNCRKFIISTNIAQTSITIPNIRYVIDSGQEKHRYFEGVWKWRKGWGSRAMAEQRSGRAGRTTHGYCYRLYSSALYANIMEQYPLPQISKQPLESIILQLKSIGISNVYSFPFPTKPSNEKILVSLLSLKEIKALQGQVSKEFEKSSITQMGKILSFIPLEPKLGKILLMGRKLKVQKYCLLIVILLTVESIFAQDIFKPLKINDSTQQSVKQQYFEELKAKSQRFKQKYKKYIIQGHFGDIFISINILGDFFTKLFQGSYQQIQSKVREQANNLNLNENVMRQVYFNTDQIAEIYQTLCSQRIQLRSYSQPNKEEINAILDILLDSFIANLCHFDKKNQYKNRHDQIVYVHNLSDNYMKSNLFLCCTQFFGNQQGRTYMRYTFPVNNYEILAIHGTVEQPKEYSWRQNQIVGLATGVIYNWQIPNLVIKDLTNNIKYYYVAKFLLEGKILETLKVLQKYFKHPPSSIRPDNLEYRVQKLVEVLKTYQADSKTKFVQLFKKDKLFLKEEIKLWVEINNYAEVYAKIRNMIINTN